MRTAIVLALLLTASAPALAINKCVGADGKVTYTEGLCPTTTQSSATVPGTARQEESRRRAQAVERSELGMQRERFGTERDRIAMERDRASLRRETASPQHESQECIAARESLRHLNDYNRRSAMRQACGLPETAERPATVTHCTGTAQHWGRTSTGQMACISRQRLP